MRTPIISAAIIIAASAFSSQSIASTTTIDFQDYGSSGISNQWFNTGDLNNLFHAIAPYTKTSSDGLGSITVSPIGDVADTAHIHVSGSGSSTTPTLPFIHGDVGGVFIDGSNSLSTFSLQKMDILQAVLKSNSPEFTHSNYSVTVRGFLGGTNGMMTGSAESDMTMVYKGGSQVATATITEADASHTFDFLNADNNFREVDYVEFFFTDFYRFQPTTAQDTALLFEFDNIVVGEVSAVPVPAAAWLFGTGLIGLISLGKRRNYLTA